MAPAFCSRDLDRTSEFWGALGFNESRWYEDHGSLILEHPMGIVIHVGLAPDLVPSENMTNASLGFATSDEAVALHDEWAPNVAEYGKVTEPHETFYGFTEWALLDPDSNLLRVGGRPEPD